MVPCCSAGSTSGSDIGTARAPSARDRRLFAFRRQHADALAGEVGKLGDRRLEREHLLS